MLQTKLAFVRSSFQCLPKPFTSKTLRIKHNLFAINTKYFSTNEYPFHTILTMPALSPTMKKGNLGEQHVKVGDKVSSGDSYCEVETDKATLNYDVVEDGYIAKILVDSHTKDIDVDTPIAVQVEEETDIAAFKDFSIGESTSATGSKEVAKDEKIEEQVKTAPISKSGESVVDQELKTSALPKSGTFASPLARKLAKESGIDLKNLALQSGSGPKGRILAGDVLKESASIGGIASSKTSVSTKESDGENFLDIAHTQMRRTIAERLTQSKQQIPHYYLSIDCCADKLLKIRKELNERLQRQHQKLEKAGTGSESKMSKLSVNDFIVKASALALKKVKVVNSSQMDNFIREYNYVDICVAVATENGLITPIVKDADLKGLTSISSEVKELAKRARAGKLLPEEYIGGTFTISNLGMMGIKQFTAIINPPQSAILAIGATRKQLIPMKDGDDEQVESDVFNVTLSCDHRVIDGAVGASQLQAFKGYIEDPVTMIL